jgi:type II secretory pathway predicted ATPase ExeA
MPPAAYALFAWQAGWVFALRSLQLATRPEEAAASLSAMAAEKQQAFADGAMAAGMAVMRGASPEVVAAAALRPAQRRVAANMRALKRPA